VALKALRHAVSGDPRRFERFRREILLARKVTHPNVCRLHDAGHHVRDAIPESREGPLDATHQVTREEVFFLTMELLAGETLATRLASDGRLAPCGGAARSCARSPPASTPLTAAAVVHRDLKCANVMLVPLAPAGLRAVVTDFGLARAGVGADELGSSGVTLSGTILGTPSYMSPEQVEGGEITAAADVYAFGVMMFEMVTGALPFHGDSALSIAMARLKQDAPSPRTLTPELDARWERVIGACMARHAADRPASAGTAVAALESEHTDLLPRGRRASGRGLAVGLAAVLLAATASLWIWRGRDRPAAPATDPVPVTAAPRIRPAVAVLGFKNGSQRQGDAWLSTAFAEMLSSEMAAGERVRTVPGETVARVKAELSLPDTDSLAADTLQRLRAGLASDYVLLGSYYTVPSAAGPQLRLDVRLQNTATGETVLHDIQLGSQDQLFAIVGRTGEALRGNLGAASGAADAAAALRPANPAAAHFYAEGLAALRLYDAARAREALMQAVAADPQFPLSYAALAEAWKRLGYDVRAAEAAEQAIKLATHLPREQRLLIEGRARLTAKDPARAAAIYRELADAFPDDPDHPLHVAEALIESGDARGALELLDRRTALPGGEQDPRLAISQALALNRLSDFSRQLDAAQRASALGNAAQANLLVAKARHFEGSALQSLGRHAEAKAAFEGALAAYEQAGDRSLRRAGATIAGDPPARAGSAAGGHAPRREGARDLCRHRGPGRKRPSPQLHREFGVPAGWRPRRRRPLREGVGGFSETSATCTPRPECSATSPIRATASATSTLRSPRTREPSSSSARKATNRVSPRRSSAWLRRSTPGQPGLRGRASRRSSGPSVAGVARRRSLPRRSSPWQTWRSIGATSCRRASDTVRRWPCGSRSASGGRSPRAIWRWPG
jgi:tetratricopeptide (TPR) repeat protein